MSNFSTPTLQAESSAMTAPTSEKNKKKSHKIRTKNIKKKKKPIIFTETLIKVHERAGEFPELTFCLTIPNIFPPSLYNSLITKTTTYLLTIPLIAEKIPVSYKSKKKKTNI